jgi:hypothetical protein
MLAMNSTLLVGPSDWDADRMPKAEFVARAGAFWRDNPPASGAIVYGDRVNHAELAYLTNFTPKLEAALALIPRAAVSTCCPRRGRSPSSRTCDRCAMWGARLQNGRMSKKAAHLCCSAAGSCLTRCTRTSPPR